MRFREFCKYILKDVKNVTIYCPLLKKPIYQYNFDTVDKCSPGPKTRKNWSLSLQAQ